MQRRILPAIVAAFFMYSAQAQTFSVQGRLQDAESKAVLQGATVIRKSKTDTTTTETTFTDSAGRFGFTGLARDSFNLIISSVGFETMLRTVVIDSADVNLEVIGLPRSSKELTGVIVTATTPPAIQKGDTLQMNASEYKVNPDASAEDLVRKMPGITVENG